MLLDLDCFYSIGYDFKKVFKKYFSNLNFHTLSYVFLYAYFTYELIIFNQISGSQVFKE